MSKIIKIGTRESELALWQANLVQNQLQELGYQVQIVPIKSSGDIELDVPLYEMGITGIFTKALDVAMLTGQVDIAVHSLKDVPTALPLGIVQAAVLERANHHDVLVYQENRDVITPYEGVVATGSLRRKAEWLHKYPKHTVVGLRGNVNTRLQKLENHHWNGAIFAAAGLARLGKMPDTHTVLDWMVPAPAQGAIMIAALAADSFSQEACAKLNHEASEICTRIEREFLRALEGGCTAPIGAYATMKPGRFMGHVIDFHGVLLSRDGTTRLEVTKTAKLSDPVAFAKSCAYDILMQGGKDILAADAVQAEAEANIKAKAIPKVITAAPQDDYVKEPTEIVLKDAAGIAHVVSTKVLSESQLMMVNKDIKIEELDFITTKILPIPPEAVRTDSMIITSQTTVRALLASFPRLNLRFKNIYCVGDKTKALVEERLGRVLYTAPSSKALAIYLCQNMSSRAVTYFCGNLRRGDISKMLGANNIKVTEVPAYETKYSGRKVVGEFSGVMFYSPSGVRSFVKANASDKIAFCIGETTAHEARTYFKNVVVAKQSTIEHMLKMVNDYYDES
ncbi:MAG: hydroxymethylbilane synthase [Robiginitomaculum sp.]|nr:MAG: hydroxymethylbilane synthase [Robiginitomaculum sp.]